MNLDLSPYLNLGFNSPSQQTRVVTEAWVAHEFYCISCGMGLTQYRANTPVYDFYSAECEERFQLKASKSPIRNRVMGAKFDKLWQSILSNTQPSLMLLHFDRPKWEVKNLTVVHRACITRSCIQRRTPLSETARRAGWEGCNIDLKDVPQLGRIEVISDGQVRDKKLVTEQWKQSSKLLQVDPIRRGWLADIIHCVERLYSTFTLDNVYSFEAELARKHPENHHVKAKIRQQLQVLRDLGIVDFVSPGVYRYKKR